MTLENAVDIVDVLDKDLGDNIFISYDTFSKSLMKHFNQIIIEKCFMFMNIEEKGIQKYELFSLLIILSKGRLEDKANSNIYFC